MISPWSRERSSSFSFLSLRRILMTAVLRSNSPVRPASFLFWRPTPVGLLLLVHDALSRHRSYRGRMRKQNSLSYVTVRALFDVDAEGDDANSYFKVGGPQ